MIFSSTFSRLVVKIWIYSLHLILCFSSLSFSSLFCFDPFVSILVLSFIFLFFLFWPLCFHLSSCELWLLHIEPIALPCCCSLCSWWYIYIYILNLFIYYHFVSNWFLLYSIFFVSLLIFLIILILLVLTFKCMLHLE